MSINRFPALAGHQALERKASKRKISPLLLLSGMAAFGCIAPIIAPHSVLQAQAQRAINVYINDQPLNFGNARPARIGGRVFVPMRAIFEALGAQVQWDSATQGINAQRGATVVQMQIGNRNANINGAPVNLDQPPVIYGGSTMVPLRFVGEALNAEVRWSEIQQAVFITDNAANTSNPLPTTPPITPPVTPPVVTPVTPVTPGTTFVPPATTGTPGTAPGYAPPQSNEVIGTVAKVDPTPPATITLRGKDANGAATLETYNIVPGARPQRSIARFPQQAGANPEWQDPFIVALPALLPGEEVSLKLNNNKQVTALTSRVLMAPAQIKSATKDQIVLNDGRDTTLNMGDQVKYVNKAGRPNTAVDVRPGESVALFVAPSTYTIFAVYARDEEIKQAGGTPNLGATVTPGTNPGTVPGTNPILPGNITGTVPGTVPPGTVPPANTALIQAVTHNATQPLKAGSTIVITVRAAMAGLRGSFTISPRMTAQPLVERADRAGIYTATYTVKPGDDVLNGRVTVALTGPNNVVDTQQSQQPITIDTQAPRITGVFPSNGNQTNNTMPNIAIFGDDIGGSGLSRGTISLTLPNGQAVNVPAVVVVGGLSGETPKALPAGQISLRATISDAAGNEAQAISVFTVMGNAPGAVNAVTHNARTALRANEVLVTELRADPNGRATFDLVGDNNRLIAVNLPMREIEAGRYQGTYTVQGNEGTNKLRVVGRFTGADNRVVTNEATTMVTLAATAAAQTAVLTVTAPTDNAQVTSPLTVSGRALGGAIVDVAIRAEGTKVTRVLLFESRRPYTQELGTQQIQATANGVWATRPIELPAPKDVEGLKFVITVTQTDSQNRRSDPITVTVTPK